MTERAAINKPILLLSLLGLGFFLYQLPTLFSGDAAADFRIYYEAALRFRDTPSALYDMEKPGFDQYLYPPPCILLFSLFSLLPLKVAYGLFISVVFISFFLAMEIWRRIWESENAVKTSRINNALVSIFLACTAMMFHNLVMGQINVIVLLLCVLFVRLMPTRPVLAGIMLALAVWIKLYPVVLVFWAMRTRQGRIVIGWAFVAGLGIALLLLPVLPFQLYLDHLHKLRELSNYTSSHIINQSLPAFLYRMGAGNEQFFGWPNVYQIPGWVKTTNLAMFIVVIVFFATNRSRAFVGATGSAFFMALIPVFSTLGWGHSFIFMAPLLFICFQQLLFSRVFPKWLTAIYLVGAVLLLIPVHNAPGFLQKIPLSLQNLYYSRFLLMALLFMTVLVFHYYRNARLNQESRLT
ncbi:DUF2029 domain-containing protein [Terrimonas sp. NA20]|uniref:DUF2029 domain-containing protein n=1 Tax=Terrimonas ginsenosidimutans TaxID=2908004 RepID=A0ABS9KWZ2_9BACT|nr:glycosyltransferase family 87 protein [Terrimonas ginsenosidimutans]MCG2616841.1 DUF2029 domain-containing protein [Terrimonas ginsenosidimutans]